MVDAALFMGLSAAILAVAWAAFAVWARIEEGPTLLARLPWALAGLALLVVAFALIVEWRCLVGWIDPDECHVWDG